MAGSRTKQGGWRGRAQNHAGGVSAWRSHAIKAAGGMSTRRGHARIEAGGVSARRGRALNEAGSVSARRGRARKGGMRDRATPETRREGPSAPRGRQRNEAGRGMSKPKRSKGPPEWRSEQAGKFTAEPWTDWTKKMSGGAPARHERRSTGRGGIRNGGRQCVAEPQTE